MFCRMVFASYVLSFADIFCDSSSQPFDYRINQYSNAEVTVNLCQTLEDFEQRLVFSIASWIKDGCNATWLTLPLDCVRYVPVLLKHNFAIHHANAEKIVLSRWLNQHAKNVLPRFPTHLVSVASLVIDEDNNVLVVKERYGMTAAYRLPGGSMEPREDIARAAMREVKEETGIETEFQAILAFSDGGTWRFCMDDVSKIYFCCLLKPLTHDITAQESEIMEARWMPLAQVKQELKGIFLEFFSFYQSGEAFILPVSKDSKKDTVIYH